MLEDGPRQVYLSACEMVATAFRVDGYLYSKSGQTMTRKVGNVAYRIRFQSSHRNVAGAFIAVWPYATVHSHELMMWRESHPLPNLATDRVAGGLLQNLGDHPSQFDWNLADSDARAQTIQNIVYELRALALPYFDRFTTPSSVIAGLVRRDIPAMTPLAALEYTLCFGSVNAANQVLQHLLRRHPGWVQRYREHLRDYQANGLPPWQTTQHGDELAFATYAYGLLTSRRRPAGGLSRAAC